LIFAGFFLYAKRAYLNKKISQRKPLFKIARKILKESKRELFLRETRLVSRQRGKNRLRLQHPKSLLKCIRLKEQYQQTAKRKERKTGG